MKALVWLGPEQMSIEDRPLPEPAVGEVLVQVGAAAICGSDMSGYLGHNSLRRPPLIMGHEFAGIVVAAGGGVVGLTTGDRVSVNPLLSDRTCLACQHGLDNLCAERQIIGIHHPGAFADFVAVPATNCHQLLPSIAVEEAAVTEPLACAVRAVGLAGPVTDRRVLVIGAGSIGLLAVGVADRRGAARIVAIDPLADRRDHARSWSANEAWSPDELIHRVADGARFDVVVDAVGSDRTRMAATTAVAPGGVVVLLGLHDEVSPLPVNRIVRWETRLIGSFCYTPAEFSEAVDLVGEGFLERGKPWLESRPLADGARAFADLAKGSVEGVKIVLRP